MNADVKMYEPHDRIVR